VPAPKPSSLLSLLALLVGLMAPACSDGGDEDSVSADEAAGVLVAQFDLPDDAADCLTKAFRDDAEARRAVGTDALPGDYQALNSAVDGCVPTDILAGSVAGLMARNYSPEGPATSAEEDCLAQHIRDLPRDRQVLLITGPLNQQIDVAAPANLEAGTVVRQLAAECGLLTTETSG
jgi:hypothetical protein